MTLILEDGGGIAGANSYVAVDEADAYFAQRGNAAWTGTAPQKEAWLIEATDLLETKTYGGIRATVYQSLSFPRMGLWVEGRLVRGVPSALKKAVCEGALRAMTGRLYPDPNPKSEATVGLLKRVRRETRGTGGAGLVSELEYFDKTQELLGRVLIPIIEVLIRDLVVSPFDTGAYR